VVKGRVYLYIYHILQYDFKKISLVVDSKLFLTIERHSKDSSKYESECLQFLVSYVYENFSKILKYTNE
jgi:hypothetical protein